MFTGPCQAEHKVTSSQTRIPITVSCRRFSIRGPSVSVRSYLLATCSWRSTQFAMHPGKGCGFKISPTPPPEDRCLLVAIELIEPANKNHPKRVLVFWKRAHAISFAGWMQPECPRSERFAWQWLVLPKEGSVGPLNQWFAVGVSSKQALKLARACTCTHCYVWPCSGLVGACFSI